MRSEYYKTYIIICRNNSTCTARFCELVTGIDDKYIKSYSKDKFEIKFSNGYTLQFVSQDIRQITHLLQGKKFGLLLFETTIDGALKLFLNYKKRKTPRKLFKMIDNAVIAKCKFEHRFFNLEKFEPVEIENYKDYHSKYGCPNPELWVNHAI